MPKKVEIVEDTMSKDTDGTPETGLPSDLK
jgi:hypothetical protein